MSSPWALAAALTIAILLVILGLVAAIYDEIRLSRKRREDQ